MPPPRSITLLSPDELRVELVALLSDALLHHATRGRLARERSSQEKSIESETASPELRSKPVLSVIHQVNDR